MQNQGVIKTKHKQADKKNIYLDYINERFFLFMKYSIVPVVISVSEEYSKLAPRKSYIDGRDFTSAHELAEYLLHLQENAGIYTKTF